MLIAGFICYFKEIDTELVNLFFLILIIGLIFSAFSTSWVQVENSLPEYLPDDSESRQGLDVMAEQFITYGTASVMVENVSLDRAETLYNELCAIDGVQSIVYLENEDYNNVSALYEITFDYSETDDKCLETLERVKEMKAKIFVGAHIEPTEDVRELAQYNIDKTLEVAAKIVEFCRTPQTFEEVLQKLFLDYNMKMNFDQYVLIGSTVRSYMAWLKNEGRLDVDFVDAKMLWKTVQEI